MFISHSEKDRWIAGQVAELLEHRGKRYRVKTFLYEKHIEGGRSIADSIRTSIQSCSEFLVLISRYSVDRPWVLIEVGAAWGLRKHVVALIDKIAPQEMPDILRSYKAIDLNDVEKYIGEVCHRARKALGR